METATWVAQGLLAFVFTMAGIMKLVQTREKVMATGGKWAEDFSVTTIKLIGAGELACAIGIIVPRWLGHGHYLTAASAAGIAVFMAGAFVTHLRRKEFPFLVVNTVLLLVAVFVCYARCPFMVH